MPLRACRSPALAPAAASVAADDARAVAALPKPPPPPGKLPALLLAVLPLALFFEEAAPGLSRWADGLVPFVAEHVAPARRWAASKEFVFARQLTRRQFRPGDVVWRAGQPADSLSFVLGGSFVLTAETLWDAGNAWPQVRGFTPTLPRRARRVEKSRI